VGKKDQLIQESFISLSVAMLKSPARWVLNQTERRILDCLEVEFHNQRRKYVPLVITYEMFVKFGIDRGSIAPALRALEGLGFIKVEHGHGGTGGDGEENKIWMTYLYTDKKHPPTHDWNQIAKEDADRIRSEWRARKDAKAVARGQKYNPKRRRPNFKVIEGNIKSTYGDWFSSRIIDESPPSQPPPEPEEPGRLGRGLVRLIGKVAR
jgi:hypothetical protein